MASASVDFLLNNILQLLKDKCVLISRVKDDLDNLKRDLSMFKAFLNDCSGRTDSDTVAELVKQIREVTHKAEDAIESYVCTAAHQNDNAAKRWLGSIIHFPKLASIADDIAKIKDDVKKIYDYRLIALDAVNLKDGTGSSSRPREKKPPIVEEDNVVGFDGEARNVIDKLNGGSDELEVVSIIGMPGLGKTTLANKVYKDREIEFEFMIRSWIYVSQNYTRKEVFLKILKDVCGRLTDDKNKMNADELVDELRRKLERHKYLIVMDDVWSKDAWTELQAAFPRNNKGSRILVTTRIRDVAVHAQEDGIYKLRFLKDDECWELLQKKVFRKERCPDELKDVGQVIAKACDGLPLAVVIIAGILLKRVRDKKWWSRIADKVPDYVVRDEEQCRKVVRWSYDNLPDHLKVCFLYIGIFPEDFEIPVGKLTFLWIAEGFIEQKQGISKEETAEEYLEELIDKNLVLVGRRTADGRIKTCRIHDMMHDLCKKLAEEDNLFNVVKDPHNFLSSNYDKINMCRRLSVHTRVLDYVKSNPSAARTRSFLSMGVQEMKLPSEHNSFIPRAFRLLRVLDVTAIIFERFPREIIGLVLLRYIAMSISFKVLPSDISKLWNMQILVVEVTSGGTIDIKADVWEMVQLRHFYTNVSAKFLVAPKMKKGNDSPSLIRTLTSISPESCTKEALAKIPDINKLGIRGNLDKFLDIKGGENSFGALAKSDHLEILKLYDNASSRCLSEGRQSGLPQHSIFPPNLKMLTLSDTMLNWDQMVTLGMLPNLVVLKLKENAFMGKYWKPKIGGFRCLEVFYLGRTDLEEWEASNDHFPLLKKLIVKYCDNLKVIPFGLAELSSLQSLDVYCTNPSVAVSARKIQQQKQNKGDNVLQVFIYPPNHDHFTGDI